MAFLDDVRQSLRVSSTAYDDEIQDIIDAAKKDLEGAGVTSPDETDAFIKRAIITYARANFGMSNPDMVKYQATYDKMKSHLAQNINYNQ